MSSGTEWWKEFFAGRVLDFVRHSRDNEVTQEEADFIEQALALGPEAKILDVPCGGGRLSFEMASRGYEVTGVDLAALDDAAFDRLHELIVDHGVLALRDQDLDEEAYVAFGARFGELTVHPIVPHIEGWPPLLNITNRGKRDTATSMTLAPHRKRRLPT